MSSPEATQHLAPQQRADLLKNILVNVLEGVSLDAVAKAQINELREPFMIRQLGRTGFFKVQDIRTEAGSMGTPHLVVPTRAEDGIVTEHRLGFVRFREPDFSVLVVAGKQI